MSKGISRRDFMRGAVAGASSLLVPGIGHILAEPRDEGTARTQNHKSVVAVVTDHTAVDEDWGINAEVVGLMVERLLRGLTGGSSVEEAWQRIIPGLSPQARIAVKVNCINPRLPSHPEVVFALAKTLTRVGVRENNIIIWDRNEGGILEGLSRCGYKINTSRQGIRCLAVSSRGVGFDQRNQLHVPSIGRNFPVTRIISQMCDYMINVSVLKDHVISGVTLSLKNFYGAIPLWNKFSVLNVKRMHRNHGNPQIAELYNNAIIKDKVRLSVCDALLGCYDGGPNGRPQWANYQLLASLDPVALDAVGLRIIDQKRQQAGLAPASRRAGYIGAADRLGLGTDKPEEIELRDYMLT